MVAGFIARQVAKNALYPVDQPPTRTPADYGIEYRDVEFPARDGLGLSGWLLNEGRPTAVVMTHFALRANRIGYQVKYQPRLFRPDKREIDFLRVAANLVDAGHTVLMYDLRNHGLSDTSASGAISGGKDEANDVLGALDLVASECKCATGLLSYCMVANATFFAADADPKAFARAGVKALVAVQPVRIGDFVRAYGLPEWINRRVAEHYAKVTGYPIDTPLLDLIPATPVPTMLVQGRHDPWTDLDMIDRFYEAIPTPKEMVWIEEADHRFDAYRYFGTNPEAMLGWFARHL